MPTWVEENEAAFLRATAPVTLRAFVDGNDGDSIVIELDPEGVGIWDALLKRPAVASRLSDLARHRVTHSLEPRSGGTVMRLTRKM